MAADLILRRCRACLAACSIAAVLGGCASAPTMKLTDLSGLQQRADRAYAHRDWQAAATAYQELVRDVPANAAYWFRLGNSHARLHQPQPAANAYRAALQRDPHIVPAWHNLGAVLLEQSQAAFEQAAATAGHDDPLRQASATIAERVAAVRHTDTAAASSAAPAARSTDAKVPDVTGPSMPRAAAQRSGRDDR